MNKDSSSFVNHKAMTRLVNYRSPNDLKKEVFMLLISNINLPSQYKWNQIFEYLDTEHTGRIRIGDLIKKLKEIEISVPKNSKLMRLYKQDKRLKIKYTDFLINIINVKEEIKDEDIFAGRPR